MACKWIAVVLPVVALSFVAGSALADDASAGEALFTKKCKVCHATEADKHKNGPSLAGVFGRKAASTSFAKYTGLKGSAVVWDEENLDQFLKNPKKFVGARTMVAKVKKEDQRADIIAYLKTLK